MESDEDPSYYCKICSKVTNAHNDPAIQCIGKCEEKVHIRCLKRGSLPCNFVGDVFYDLVCLTCSDSGEEVLIRQKLPWLTVVVLTLYNLREKSSGLSRRGYFHWKSDISTFVNNNWDHLFGKTVKRKKNWMGTISGTLSHYGGLIFKSGTAVLGDQGWWRLIENDPPEVIVDKHQKGLEMKKQNQARLRTKGIDSSKSEPNNFSNNSSGDESFRTTEIKIQHETKSNAGIFQNISPCDEFADILDLGIDIPSLEADFPSFNLAVNSVVEDLAFRNNNEVPSIIDRCLLNAQEEPFEDVDVADVSMTENYKESNEILKVESESSDSCDEQEANDNIKSNELPPAVPSLFTQSTPRPWPWDESFKLNLEDVRPMMSKREEEYLLQKIEQYKHLLDSAPPCVRRLYRKLSLRKLKRQYGLPMLDIDNCRSDKGGFSQFRKKGNKVLDRFISEDMSIFFDQRLQGHCEPTSVHSPYTNRLLKPYIRRDVSARPLWLKVMMELLAKVNRKNPGWEARAPAPIDYSYIRPQHIPAINSLCTQFFWPGVDLTECLQYPDFTCVVLYKKLVIGFAILVPDVGYNEAYISFFMVRPEWQKAGIGTFMLYHLIQTCMGKDITLHVSATNPALILYQKFGFKQEEFVQDFYDKYMSPSSKESRHALFLRLRR